MRKILKITVMGVLFSVLLTISYSSVYADIGGSKVTDVLGTWLNEKTTKTASSISEYGLEEPVSSTIETNRDLIITKIGVNPQSISPQNLTSTISSNFGITYNDLKPKTIERP